MIKHSIPPMAAGAKCVFGGIEWTLDWPRENGMWRAQGTDGRTVYFHPSTWSEGESHTPAPSSKLAEIYNETFQASAPPSVVERPLADGWTYRADDIDKQCSRCLTDIAIALTYRYLYHCLPCAEKRGAFAPVAPVAECKDWCGLPYDDQLVPAGHSPLDGPSRHWNPTGEGFNPFETIARCSQACADRAAARANSLAATTGQADQVITHRPTVEDVPPVVAADSLKTKVSVGIDYYVATSVVAALPPMPLDTSRTMASREPRWKTDRDVTVGVDLDDSWLGGS